MPDHPEPTLPGEAETPPLGTPRAKTFEEKAVDAFGALRDANTVLGAASVRTIEARKELAAALKAEALALNVFKAMRATMQKTAAGEQ